MSSFGQRLKELRQSHKLTQKDLAYVLQITERNYQGYEYDKIKPSYDNLIALADYFDVSLDYLIGKDPSEQKEKLPLAFREYFSGKLSSMRQQRGVTLKQLADALGMTEEELELLESGASSPSFEIVRDIADFFQLSFDLFTGFPESYEDKGVKIKKPTEGRARPYCSAGRERGMEIEEEFLNLLTSSNYRGSNIEVYKAIRALVDYDRLRMGQALCVEAAAILGDSINVLLTEETDRDKRRRFAKVIVAAKKKMGARK